MTKLTDSKGRPYAKLSDLQANSRVQCDDGFPCIRPWSKLKVQKDHLGKLFISCEAEAHYFDGQLQDDSDTLIGIYKL